MKVSVILFDDFTALDVFGPVEVLSIPEYTIEYYSLNGGVVSNHQGINILTKKCADIEPNNIILIPGGFGTRKAVQDIDLISMLKKLASESKYCLTVCTGSALLAATGMLNEKKATSNKRSLAWVKTFGENVFWDENSRYVHDGKYYTSSGVSAGIDMALGFISDQFDKKYTEIIKNRMEYFR